MFYLANSSTRFAIRRLSSGQRSFKPIRLLALLGSENTWVNKYYKSFIDIQFSLVYTDQYILFLNIPTYLHAAVMSAEMAHVMKYLPLLWDEKHQSPARWSLLEKLTFHPDDKPRSIHFLSSPVFCPLSLVLSPSCHLICASLNLFYCHYWCFLGPSLKESLPFLQLLKQTQEEVNNNNNRNLKCIHKFPINDTHQECKPMSASHLKLWMRQARKKRKLWMFPAHL